MVDGLERLESVKTGKNCFRISDEERKDGVCRITNCPNLHQLEIGDHSFEDFKSFELSNLNSIQSIKFGDLCFWYANCSLKGEWKEWMKEWKKCDLNENENDVLDLPSLEIVTFGWSSFSDCHLAVFESMWWLFIFISFLILDLPKLYTISFNGEYALYGDNGDNRKTMINGHESYDNTLIMKSM